MSNRHFEYLNGIHETAGGNLSYKNKEIRSYVWQSNNNSMGKTSLRHESKKYVLVLRVQFSVFRPEYCLHQISGSSKQAIAETSV